MSDTTLEITCYTDPHCPTCWGMEPVLRRLLEVHADRLVLRPVMGGLVREQRSAMEGTSATGEPWYKVSARRWAEVSRRYRMPVEIGIFAEITKRDFSSYPACIAYAAARMQNPARAKIYLRRLREAFAVEQRDIQVLRIQIALAVECGLNRDSFIEAIQGGEAQKAFAADLEECEIRGITGLPTYLLRRDEREIEFSGHTPYAAFSEAINKLGNPPPPGIVFKATLEEIYNFISRHERAALVEIAAVYNVDEDYIRDVLDQLVGRGLIIETVAGKGSLFQLSGES